MVTISIESEIVLSALRQEIAVQAVSDQRRNPFGIKPPCSSGEAVCGYGDPAADFHVIGDHPGIHGGKTTGVPFTESPSGRAIQALLADVGFLADEYATEPIVNDLYLSYRYMCDSVGEEGPSASEYAEHDRFLDAEIRAVNAHVLIPVGATTTDYVLTQYSTRVGKIPDAIAERHAQDVRGRGFLVLPCRDPAAWTPSETDRFRDALGRIKASDYRQTKGVATMYG